jgi:hypothetical protein
LLQHFAEIYHTTPGSRVFNIDVEGEQEWTDVDIVDLKAPNTAFTLETTRIVSDGFLSLSLYDAYPKKDQPKLSGIEIRLLGLHLAHAVAVVPKKAVDMTGNGFADVPVNGIPSHTHGIGLVLVSYAWKLGATVLATTESATLSLPVGEHFVTLTVVDDGGNDSTEGKPITVNPFGYPALTGLSPDTGSIAGGEEITIIGSGFTYSAADTVVHFGLYDLTGDDIEIVDQYTIKIISPATVLGLPTLVSVTTPLDTSNEVTYTYIAGMPIEFTEGTLNLDGINILDVFEDFYGPTALKFGPDGKLYVVRCTKTCMST